MGKNSKEQIISGKSKLNNTNEQQIKNQHGAGALAERRHLPSLVKSDHVEVVALCQRNQEMLIKMANYFNIEKYIH